MSNGKISQLTALTPEAGQSSDRRPIFLTLGMHRSGTSVVVRALEVLEINLGDRLLGPSEGDNDKGFWEDKDILDLEERLLAKSGTTQDSLAPFSADFKGQAFSEERVEAGLLLQDKLSMFSNYGFKNPRSGLLLDFWKCVIDDLGLEPRFIIAVRNPLEVAKSLNRRNHFPLERSLILWAKYCVSIVEKTEGDVRVFVNYERMMEDPEFELIRISEGLKLGRDRLNAKALDHYSTEFLDADLKRFTVSPNELDRNPDIPAWLTEFYKAMQAMGSAPPTEGVFPQEVLDEARAGLDGIKPLVAIYDSAEALRADAARRLQEAEEKANASVAQLESQTNSLTALKEELERLQLDRDRVAQDYAVHQSQLEQKDQTIADLSSDVSTLRGELIEFENTKMELAANREQLEQKDQTIADLSSDVSTLRGELIEFENTKMELAANREQIEYLQHESAAKTEQHEVLLGDVERFENQISELSAESSLLKETQKLAEAEKQEKERLLNELAILQSKLQTELASKEKLFAEAKHQRDTVSEELKALQDASRAETASLQSVVERLHQRTFELSEIAEQQPNNENKIASLEDELSSSHQRLDEALIELDLMRSQAAEAYQESSELFDATLKSHETALQLLMDEHARDLANAHAKLGEELSAKQEKLDDLESSQIQSASKLMAQGKKIDSLTAVLEVTQSALDESRRALDETLAAQDTILAELNGERNGRGAMQTAFLKSQSELRLTRQSLSWRLTSPLRLIGMAMRQPRRTIRFAARRLLGAIWRAIPIGAERRGRMAKRIVLGMPFLFKSTSLYQAFKAADEVSLKQLPIDRSLTATGSLRHDQFQLNPAASAPDAVKARAFAFYLPQFHAIPENDAWWGEGFTEWSKVAPATPKFEGHYQPHVPIDLGYYDLKQNPGIMRQQADLAHLHGLSGFCFYFYWFAGKTLLELPIENYHEDSTIEFPYCLCWANENWSRRWDGRDDDVLIQQDHSAADDIAFIQHISKYLKDPKYTHIDGRPLLLVYRPSLLPNALETTQRWRQFARENGIGELYLAYTQSFEAENPAIYGFDAAIEFPPNNSGLEKDSSQVKPLTEPFDLNIYDWTALEKRSENYPTPDYRLFRGVTPSWDNTARRPDTGAVMLGSQPDRYGRWLTNAIKDTQARFVDPEERLVFINAWNEWAEGAHLEPDAKYGYAWLHETRTALAAQAEAPQRKILVVAHDLHKHGAQYLSMNFLRSLKHDYGYEVAAIAGGDGALADQYRELGTLDILDRNLVSPAEIEKAIAGLKLRGFEAAIVNSSASGWIVPYLHRHGIRSVGLVHELPNIIRDMSLEPNLRAMNDYCDKVIFAATMVRDQSADAAGLHSGWSNPVIRPQGLYKSEGIADISEKARAREKICHQLKVGPRAKFVLGVGYADHRKGLDIFVKWAIASTRRWSDVHFVWLGKLAPDMEAAAAALLRDNPETESHLHFPGFVDNTFDFYLAADLYALTSREDPFPSTALEALNAATPVILVQGCTGIEDLSDNDGVRVIASEDEADFLDTAATWLDDSAARTRAGQSGRAEMQSRFGFVSFVGEVLDLLDEPWPDVSVIVPNYNYAKFMGQRLGSILDQSVPARELIFLDDASTDDSVAVAKEILRNAPINIKYDLNQANSGSVFAQWRRGVEQASGEYVWIAEADDWADSDFLKVTTRALRQSGVVFAYTQSNQVDQNGNILARDYLDYVRDIDGDLWKRDYQRSGREEAIRAMSVKNVAPNVSGMLFRRDALLKVLKEFETDILSYRVAGDWCVYTNLLRYGDVAFAAEPLNFHRRHSQSVTISRFSLADLAEIAKMQIYVDDIFGVPADMKSKADAYLDKLIDDFELASKFDAQSIAAAKRGRTKS